MSLKSSPKNSILPSLLERVAATSVWNTLPCSYVIKHCCSGFQENQIKLCDSWMNLSALFLLIAFLFLPLHLSFRSDIAYINCSTFETTSLKANLLCACMCVCVRMCMCGCVHVCVCMRTFVPEAADTGRIQCLPGKSGRLPSISAKMQPTDHTSTEYCQGAKVSTSQTSNTSTVQTCVKRGYQCNHCRSNAHCHPHHSHVTCTD